MSQYEEVYSDWIEFQPQVQPCHPQSQQQHFQPFHNPQHILPPVPQSRPEVAHHEEVMRQVASQQAEVKRLKSRIEELCLENTRLKAALKRKDDQILRDSGVILLIFINQIELIL